MVFDHPPFQQQTILFFSILLLLFSFLRSFYCATVWQKKGNASQPGPADGEGTGMDGWGGGRNGERVRQVGWWVAVDCRVRSDRTEITFQMEYLPYLHEATAYRQPLTREQPSMIGGEGGQHVCQSSPVTQRGRETASSGFF